MLGTPGPVLAFLLPLSLLLRDGSRSKLDFPGGSAGKESAHSMGDLGWEDPLEKGMATHSSILAWRIPWGHEESDTTERLSLTSHVNVRIGRRKSQEKC